MVLARPLAGVGRALIFITLQVLSVRLEGQAGVLHDFLDRIGVEHVVDSLETNSDHLCFGHFVDIGR